MRDEANRFFTRAEDHRAIAPWPQVARGRGGWWGDHYLTGHLDVRRYQGDQWINGASSERMSIVWDDAEAAHSCCQPACGKTKSTQLLNARREATLQAPYRPRASTSETGVQRSFLPEDVGKGIYSPTTARLLHMAEEGQQVDESDTSLLAEWGLCWYAVLTDNIPYGTCLRRQVLRINA